MAKIKTKIGDNVSGKLRNLVFYEMNGKSYVRSAPVTNENTWNEEQRMRRKRIVKIGELWRALKSDQFSRIWNSAARQMNGYAWFVKANMPALELDGSVIDARLLKVAEGSLTMVQNLQVEAVEASPLTVQVSWHNDSNMRKERLNDALMAISYDMKNFSEIHHTGLKRQDMQGRFTLPLTPENATHVYLFMASPDGKTYSQSMGFKI